MTDLKHNYRLFNLGHIFKPSTRTASKIVIAICLFGIYFGLTLDTPTMSFAAFLTCIVCFLILHYKSSVEIDFDTNKFRECSSIFNYKSGKWRNFTVYTDLAILTTRKTIRNEIITVGAFQDSIDYFEKETAVYLLTKSHRHRVLIKVCTDYKATQLFAEQTALELYKNYTFFNPVRIESVNQNSNRH